MDIFFFILISFIASILITYFYFFSKLKSPETIKIPEEGNLADLKNGKLYYRWFLPKEENGETLVLVHGFSTPSVVWEGVVPFLVDNGYKVWFMIITVEATLLAQKLNTQKVYM